ncbi:phage baseplate assembly protein V [Thauera humireducens]
MSSALHLSLLMGPIVPVPVPAALIDAFDEATVTHAAGSVSGFQLRFRVHSKSALNTIFLVAVGQNTSLGTPPLRVVLIVTLNGRPQPLFDGVVTHVEVQSSQDGQPGSITVTGEDLTKVMDLIDFSGLPYPAMPIEARVALICAKYAAFGIIPLPIPALFPDVPIPIERIPAQQGTDLAYLRELADEIGHVFYIEPGEVPMTNVAYFGPEIKVGPPQPALNVDMDAHTNVESLNFSFDPTKGVLPVVFIQNAATRAPIPIPIPNLNPLQPPRPAAGAPGAPEDDEADGQDEPDAGHLGRSGGGQELAGCGERTRRARRAALWPHAEGAPAGGGAWRGRRLRRAVLREQRHQHDPPRPVPSELRADAQRADLHHAEGADMSERYYGKYRGMVLNNIDPMQQGRLQVQVPDVAGLAPASWAMPCVPIAGLQNGMVALPVIGSGVWIEFEQGNPEFPIWVGCFWGSAAEIPALALATPPGLPAITFQTPLQNGLTISDLPGPTGGIMLKSATGATLIVNDTGIYIQNGKGASITLLGPSVTINNGALMVT